ncbi:MAG: hypothetical protein Q9220_004325 [cf. Caloplaca sp. 1 TL-2023]
MVAVITEQEADIFDSPQTSILIRSWGSGVAAAFKKYSPSAYHHQLYHCTTPSSPSIPLVDHQKSLVGSALLIPPFPSLQLQKPKSKTPPAAPKTLKPTPAQRNKKFWIACLFTSYSYGKSVDPPASILEATERAVADLERQIREYRDKQAGIDAAIADLHAQITEVQMKKTEDDDDNDEPNTTHSDLILKLETEITAKGKEKGEEMGGVVSVRINSGLFGVEWSRSKEVLEGAGVDMIVVRPKDVVVGGNKEVEGEGKVGKKRKGEGGGGKRQVRLRF